jgi:hypothetical protein
VLKRAARRGIWTLAGDRHPGHRVLLGGISLVLIVATHSLLIGEGATVKQCNMVRSMRAVYSQPDVQPAARPN